MTLLEPIDDMLGTNLPLVSFHNLGSMLFAEDLGVPVHYHTTPEFILCAGGRVAYVVTDEARRTWASRPPTRIDDDLVVLMKRPITLPSRSAGSAPSDETHGDSCTMPALARPTAHRPRDSALLRDRSNGLIPSRHTDPLSCAEYHLVGPVSQDHHRESLRRDGSLSPPPSLPTPPLSACKRGLQ
ncbi:hypothetical protein LshimejAT787_0210710 [Lyophyllum shimeji]|uniref:Uncharacterized protein n=1 Tax=Lyophyllum shimeji TaxID=47721 RepID=A0A9P3PHC5_LYOSH|nr:hypothetical protein LshimejAT787_0210710 [Lyophyllum shimeji]